jgi:hypothetical protein
MQVAILAAGFLSDETDQLHRAMACAFRISTSTARYR